MSFQAYDDDSGTIEHNSGSWQKIDGKMAFVEERFVTSSVHNSMFESSNHKRIDSNDIVNQSLLPSVRSPLKVPNAPNYSSNNCKEILKRLSTLEEHIQTLKKENRTLKSEVRDNKRELEYQLQYIYALEVDVNRLDQYGRRENIEIGGIPGSVSDQDLENEVLNILNKMGLNSLNHYGIVGCHRIGKRDHKGNRNTIVRFLHRKDAIFILKNKRNARLCNELGYYKLTIMENLCPAFKSIFEEMKELKNNGIIEKVWTYNGHIKYMINDSDQEKPRIIHHDSELDYFYK